MRFLVLFALCLAACTSPDAPTADDASEATTVYLVRHAEKVDESADPPLSEIGMARAQALADSLAPGGIDAVLVTPYQRTSLTAQPLTERLAITPTVVSNDGGVDSLAVRTARAVRALPAGSRVLVVGHSNTVGPTVEALGGPTTADLPSCEYDTLFEVTLAEDVAFVARTYGDGGEGCAMPMDLEL